MVTQMLWCCVVNTSHCVGGLATVVGMLAVGGLYIFLVRKINCLFSTLQIVAVHSYCWM